MEAVSFRRNVVFLVLLFSTILLIGGGCSSVQVNEMPLNEGQTSLNQGDGSLYILSLKTDNKFKPTWPPEVYSVKLVDQITNKEISIAVQSMSVGSLLNKGISDTFTFDKGTSSWEGLINFSLPPGKYKISSIDGGCNRGIGIGVALATFEFPFDIPFQTFKDETVYLGRIEMINRERTSDKEIPSGDTTNTRKPQYDSGFATGTFDVKIYDNLTQDIVKFNNQYPVLGSITFQKRILPPWSRPSI